MPALRTASRRLRKRFHRVHLWMLDRRPILDAAPLLKKAMAEARPYAAGKMGSVECSVVYAYLQRRQALQTGRTPPEYKPDLVCSLHINAGVFPQTTESIDRFCADYLEAVSQCDAVCAWGVTGEAQILSRHCPSASLVQRLNLEPYLYPHPWTAALAGKKVLVVSPFVDSIRKQYARRTELWRDPAVLPEFELLTLRTPFSAGIAAPQDADWFAAVARLQAGMDEFDYDIALVGAGAFSLPLVVHAKRRGKVGIHMGGVLQLLFGIYGRRWLIDKSYAGFINDAWVRPSAEETPTKFREIENGSYW